MTGFSLNERSKLFRRKFPETSISAGHLGRIYKAYNGKKKVIWLIKIALKYSQEALNSMLIQAKNEVCKAIQL